MTDRREAILERLVTICAISGINAVARNRLTFNDTEFPAIGILEGDEEPDEKDPEPRPANAPRNVMMIPEIVVMMGAAPETVGASINALKIALHQVLTTDATLLALVVNGRRVRYLGMGSGLGYGRDMEATIALRYGFTYLL
jgi:hypothetical protein